MTTMTPADYCKKCDAPPAPMIAVLMRCGPCSVKNGQLPPTKYRALIALTEVKE